MSSQIVNAFRALWQAWQRPPEGRIVHYDPHVDSLRSTLTKQLTFAKLESMLNAGDDGDITDTLQLFEEMERRDPRLKSVARTRRRALSGLQWAIVSAADKQQSGVDKTLANEAADYCREVLSEMPSARTGLRHQSKALGANLAVTEIVWAYGKPIDLTPIPSRRLTMDTSKSLDIRVITKDEPLGIVARSPKFIVHTPDASSGSPLSESLMRAQATLWLVKKLALADWATFVEIFGMPVRIGRYKRGTSSPEKTEARNMLRDMSSNAWALVSDAIELIFQESGSRGTSSHEALMNYCSRETSILWLGGNLTSEVEEKGSFAAARVHDEVRDDLRDDDIEAEATTIREQLLTPMVQFHWPGRDVPVPYFDRVVPENVDPKTVAEWQLVGLEVGEEWARRVSKIPPLGEDERRLEPSLDLMAEGIDEGNPNAAF